MSEIDIKKLESLISEDKIDEAKALLSEFLTRDLTHEEKASLYLNYASIYFQTVNKINARYNTALRKAISSLEKINATEKEVAQKFDLAEVRSSL